MELAGGGAVTVCKCKAIGDHSFMKGRHWMTVCSHSWRIWCHNKVRDIIAEMYKSLHIPAETEVSGRYTHINSHGEVRPADVLPSQSATGADMEQALDVAITDPTMKTALDVKSDRFPLSAAKDREGKKISEFRPMMREAAEAGAPIEKIPLVMETTGAFGIRMQKWWKEMKKLEAEFRSGRPLSLQDQGLEHTWSANVWSTFQRQKLSMGVARLQAEGIIKKISQNLPEGAQFYKTAA